MKTLSTETLQRPCPTLVVKCGNTEKKFLALDHDGMTLGRARGCDIELTAPEVSAVHCIISRSPMGLSIRDCQSRAGTRINGQRVQVALLHDGDILNVGPFSFEVHIPGVYLLPPERVAVGGLTKSRQQHLNRSRKHLAHLALSLRRRLREKEWSKKPGPDSPAFKQPKADLEVLAESLRNRNRHFEQKLLELEEGERQLAVDRDLLNRETAAFEKRILQAEQELEARRLRLEAELNSRPTTMKELSQEPNEVLSAKVGSAIPFSGTLEKATMAPSRGADWEGSSQPPPSIRRGEAVLEALCGRLTRLMESFNLLQEEASNQRNVELKAIRELTVSFKHLLESSGPQEEVKV